MFLYIYYDLSMKSISIILSIVVVLIFSLAPGCSRALHKASTSEYYNVKRDSLVWNSTFKNTSISKIPIVKSIDAPRYSYSVDYPQIEYSMTVEYYCKSQIDELILIVVSELKKKGFEVQLGCATCGQWAWRFNTNDNTFNIVV